MLCFVSFILQPFLKERAHKSVAKFLSNSAHYSRYPHSAPDSTSASASVSKGEPQFSLEEGEREREKREKKSSRKKQLATGYNAWVAIHNISASRRWRWQPGAGAGAGGGTGRRSRRRTCMVAMCKDVVVGSTANRQMYIDMGWQLRERDSAGRDGMVCQTRQDSLPQTTRVRKAINKQDTSRMSNINNKNESRSLAPSSNQPTLPPTLPPPSCPPAARVATRSIRMNDVWMAMCEWQPEGRGLARMSAYLCCAYWRHLRPPRPRTISHLSTSPSLPFPSESSANRKYLCIMQSELRRI